MSRTFSVAEQAVTDPVTGATVKFEVDAADTSLVRCRVYPAPETPDAAHSGDYLNLTFQRNGLLLSTEMVDAAAEEDTRLRNEASARLGRQGAATAQATDEERKAAAETQAKQAADDKVLLDSAPKVSKYALKPGDQGYVAPDQPGVAGALARGEFHQSPAVLESPGSNRPRPAAPGQPADPRQPGVPYGQEVNTGRPQGPVGTGL